MKQHTWCKLKTCSLLHPLAYLEDCVTLFPRVSILSVFYACHYFSRSLIILTISLSCIHHYSYICCKKNRIWEKVRAVSTILRKTRHTGLTEEATDTQQFKNFSSRSTTHSRNCHVFGAQLGSLVGTVAGRRNASGRVNSKAQEWSLSSGLD